MTELQLSAVLKIALYAKSEMLLDWVFFFCFLVLFGVDEIVDCLCLLYHFDYKGKGGLIYLLWRNFLCWFVCLETVKTLNSVRELMWMFVREWERHKEKEHRGKKKFFIATLNFKWCSKLFGPLVATLIFHAWMVFPHRGSCWHCKVM